MTIEMTNPTTNLTVTEKKAYLAQRLKRKTSTNGVPTTTIPPRPQQKPIPLTFVQEGIWYLEQLRPDKATYNMPVTWTVQGPLNVAALEQAFNDLLQRHDILRTSFQLIDGQPVQVIAPDLALTIRTLDLQHLKNEDQEIQAQQLVEKEWFTPFNLTQAPLLRVTLIQLAADKHIFLLNMHHIISDAWSLGILTRELSALYGAFAGQQLEANLPKLSIQYADFAVWQRDHLQNKALEKHIAYWRQQLAGAPPLLELPTDYGRPAVQSYKGDTVKGKLSTALTQALERLSVGENASLFMTLLTAFNILLYRHTGQDDIVVGAPMINRRYIETENLIGYFLNNLALRTSLADTLSFSDLLKSVRQTTLDAYSHQELPFEKLVQELQPQRDLSYTPIFQVFFNMFTSSTYNKALKLADLEIKPFVGHEMEVGSKFDMTMYIQKLGDDVHLNLVYKTSLFRRGRIEEMLAQYVHLLQQIVDQPHRPIAELSLVTPEARTILPDPTTPLSDVWPGAVQTQFARMAHERPHQTAIIDPQETWSYQELDQRSNQLAQRLIAQGIRPGDVVAIYGHRSDSLIWAWLGVLKAGGALVNLDPAYPVERLLHYLTLSNAKGIIQIEAAGPLPAELADTVAPLACQLTLPPLSTVRRLDPLAGCSTADPGITVGPDDTASITFTSGSTGQPKGVRGRHGPLSHFLPWQTDAFNLSAADHFSMLSGLAHDPLQRDIFTALWVGATIYIPDPDQVGTPGYLAQWMAHHKITFAHMTPPMGQILTETAQEKATLPRLRYAFFVGDKLTRQDVAQLQRLAPDVTCINSYGSTETQRAVGYHCIPPGRTETSDDRLKAVYPLGQGMPGAQLLVLNQSQELAGIGEVGEIYLRSPHLAGGYVGDEALTNARFIANPFSNLADDRLYRTGDLGRYRPDGLVEFAGRADRQVKIRGFRVELGEIEYALAQHPLIQNAVVTARNDLPGGNKLVAYFVTDHSGDLAIEEARSFLQQRFPDYMVPFAYVKLETMPLTPNGKIDYRRLPAPQHSDIKSNEGFVAPRNETEQQLAAIWQNLLGSESVSIHDDFFELGGHSLLAIRLFTQIEQQFGKKLPLTTLFQSPTIAGLAQAIHNDDPVDWSTVVPIQPGNSKTPFFCVHGLGGGVVGYGEAARLLGPSQPFYGLQAKGIDGVEAPDSDIETMAARYIQAMRTVQPHGPYQIGGYCYGGVIAFEMARQLKAQGEPVALVAMFEGYAPLRGQDRESIWRSPRLMFNFMRNLPFWAADNLALGPEQLRLRVKRKIRRHWKLFVRKFGRTTTLGVDDVLDDTSHIPDHLRQLMQTHLRAMSQYNPGPYDGSITLFRVRSQPLSRTPDPTMGWNKLVTGGLEIKKIAGSHHNIFEQPHVQSVAEKLKECLLQT
ncbi:MAG: amino acid adenylation domain-containing protein [Anaerolineae bacterium]|nr:amino acid adenylation domain-containing protein [Anaerolineae bacterium]